MFLECRKGTQGLTMFLNKYVPVQPCDKELTLSGCIFLWKEVRVKNVIAAW